jgi:hypothetical protein
MKTAFPVLAISVLALTLSACAAGPRGPRFTPGTIERALKGAPGEAQPSKVVATEVAMSQAEKEEGVWSARSRFTASGALWHVNEGAVDAVKQMASLRELDGTADWGTRTVVMSCDGALAVALGRFRSISGKYGTYVTTWVRQSDNSYKWTYNTDWIDNPQPPPRPVAEGEDSLITVVGIDAIQGLVASCPRADAPVLPPPALSLADDFPGAAQLSKDGTLRWRWEQWPEGVRHVVVEYWYEGEWVTAIEEGLASPRER